MARKRMIPNVTFMDEVQDPAILCSASNLYYLTAVHMFNLLHPDVDIQFPVFPYRVVYLSFDNPNHAEVVFYNANNFSECIDDNILCRIPCKYSDSWFPRTVRSLKELEDYAQVAHVSDDDIRAYMTANKIV